MNIGEAKNMIAIFTIYLSISFPLSVFANIVIAYERFIFNKAARLIRIALDPFVTLPILLVYPKAWIVVLTLNILGLLMDLSNAIYAIRKLKVKVSFKNLDFSILKEIFRIFILCFFTNTSR